MRSNSFSKQHQATGPPQQYFTAVEEQEPHSNELTANATATTFFQNAAASPTGSRQDFTAAEGQEAYSNEMTAADDVTTISFQNNDAAVEEKEAHSSTNEPASFVTTPPSPDAFNDIPVAVRVLEPPQLMKMAWMKKVFLLKLKLVDLLMIIKRR